MVIWETPLLLIAMYYQSPLKLRIKVTNDFNLIKEGIPETQNNLREFTLNMCSLEPLSIPKSISQASARKGEPVGGVCVCLCVCVHTHTCVVWIHHRELTYAMVGACSAISINCCLFIWCWSSSDIHEERSQPGWTPHIWAGTPHEDLIKTHIFSFALTLAKRILWRNLSLAELKHFPPFSA